MIKIEELERIIQVVDKYDICHFEFQDDKSKIIIDKQNKSEKTIEVQKKQKHIQEGFINNEEKDFSSEIQKKYIKANFAGTFYSKRESDEPEFIKINDKVMNNTIVGLLEVMKLFNEVEAGVEGIIVDILVKNGEFVEYGQPLFEVEVDKYV